MNFFIIFDREDFTGKRTLILRNIKSFKKEIDTAYFDTYAFSAKFIVSIISF